MRKKHPEYIMINKTKYKYSCSRKKEKDAIEVVENLRKRGYAATYLGSSYIGYKEPKKVSFHIYKKKRKKRKVK